MIPVSRGGCSGDARLRRELPERTRSPTLLRVTAICNRQLGLAVMLRASELSSMDSTRSRPLYRPDVTWDPSIWRVSIRQPGVFGQKKGPRIPAAHSHAECNRGTVPVPLDSRIESEFYLGNSHCTAMALVSAKPAVQRARFDGSLNKVSWPVTTSYPTSYWTSYLALHSRA